MFRQWADEKVLVTETAGWLHGYADRVELMAAELVRETETYLGEGWDA
jgi:hypothetical protein